MMTISPGEVVRQFCAGVDRKDLAAVEALLDEKVVYHNIGSEPAVGREATLAAVQFQFDMFDPSSSGSATWLRTVTPSSPNESML